MAEKQVLTLGDLKTNGWWIVANCDAPNCGRGRTLDLDILIAKYYRDYTIIGDEKIAARLRCSSCGHKGGSLTFSAPSTAA